MRGTVLDGIDAKAGVGWNFEVQKKIVTEIPDNLKNLPGPQCSENKHEVDKGLWFK